MSKGTILSGMRSTGKLHLGNYVGALENWVRLEQEGHQCYYMVANWHSLTTNVKDTNMIKQDTIDMVTDWLCAGIDPEKSPVFIQSEIKEHAELHLLFSMLITVSRLERNPTVKEQIRDLHLEEKFSYGHLGYPVLQAADILMYKANLVPVGEDQAPHVEITREIARKFNQLFGEVFPVPDVKLTKFARLPGLDAKKMSKSLDNMILLSDAPDLISKKVMKAITDPQKVRLHDPGRPEICTVYTYHTKFNPMETEQIATDCRSGALGCVACKKNLSSKLSDWLEPFREKRSELVKKPDRIKEIIGEGNDRAREVAQTTMSEVRAAIDLW